MSAHSEHLSALVPVRLGIDTHQEPVVYLRADSPVCRSEGFTALSRVQINTSHNQQAIATLNMVTSEMLKPGHIGFSESAWRRLRLSGKEQIYLSHPRPVESLSHVRAKVYGHALDQTAFQHIIDDIVEGRYADVHVAAFITACGDDHLNNDEIAALTSAMINVGSRLQWHAPVVVDKHCVGGLPGNRTTPIVTSILAAAGQIMPKTSSRAITSPAGTADTMETLTDVGLSLAQMQAVVKQEGACLVWGGSMQLSPADDLLIKVERALDIDSEGQLIASVLSKKIAAGATHVLIDIPVGPTAKVRSQAAAEQLSASFIQVAKQLGIHLQTLITDGRQPVGRGIGPALEANDVLAVLKNQPDAPQDLLERACLVAGAMLEMIDSAPTGEGANKARQIIENGQAFEKFKAICLAQGGLKTPPFAPYSYHLVAPKSGAITDIDNRKLAKVAKLAGAPADPAAGIEIFVKLGQRVAENDILLTVHAASAGVLNYAVETLLSYQTMIGIDTPQEKTDAATAV